MYPDIFLLPELATFFNLSVDELLNYQPQLTKEKIRECYLHFSAEFVTSDFNDVLAECQSIINKYYACLPFLIKMATLLLNHVSLAATREDQETLLEDILRLVRRVKRESLRDTRD